MKPPQPVNLESVEGSVQRAHDLCAGVRRARTRADALGQAEVARQHLRIALDELADLRAREQRAAA